MDKQITFLGTGAAIVYNSLQASFVLDIGKFRMLVDTMGGYDIIKALRKNNISVTSLNAIFITHRHIDHSLGFPWIVRIIGSAVIKNKNLPKHFELKVLCSSHVQMNLEQTVFAMCPEYWNAAKKFITFVKIKNGLDIQLTKDILVSPMDTESKKEEQHGFILKNKNYKIVCTGDEWLREKYFPQAQNCDILIHEAFCLESEEKQYKAYEKHHCTVLHAARNAQAINAKHLITYHTEDEKPNRKQRFTKEAKTVFKGKITVPNDGEIIKLK